MRLFLFLFLISLSSFAASEMPSSFDFRGAGESAYFDKMKASDPIVAASRPQGVSGDEDLRRYIYFTAKTFEFAGYVPYPKGISESEKGRLLKKNANIVFSMSYGLRTKADLFKNEELRQIFAVYYKAHTQKDIMDVPVQDLSAELQALLHDDFRIIQKQMGNLTLATRASLNLLTKPELETQKNAAVRKQRLLTEGNPSSFYVMLDSFFKPAWKVTDNFTQIERSSRTFSSATLTHGDTKTRGEYR